MSKCPITNCLFIDQQSNIDYFLHADMTRRRKIYTWLFFNLLSYIFFYCHFIIAYIFFIFTWSWTEEVLLTPLTNIVSHKWCHFYTTHITHPLDYMNQIWHQHKILAQLTIKWTRKAIWLYNFCSHSSV